MVPGRAKPVLHGPNSTEPNLFHHGETTYRVGRLSEYATLMVLRIDLWNKVAVDLESRVASLVRRDELLDPMLLGAKFSTDTTASLVFGVDAGAFSREGQSEFAKYASLCVTFTLREKLASIAYMVPGLKLLIDLLKIPIYSPTATKYFIKLIKNILRDRKDVDGDATTNLVTQMNKVLNTCNSLNREPEDPKGNQPHLETLVIANLLIMLVAGLETTGMSLGYCIWALALNPGWCNSSYMIS